MRRETTPRTLFPSWSSGTSVQRTSLWKEDLNLWPFAYQTNALPTELLHIVYYFLVISGDYNPTVILQKLTV